MVDGVSSGLSPWLGRWRMRCHQRDDIRVPEVSGARFVWGPPAPAPAAVGAQPGSRGAPLPLHSAGPCVEVCMRHTLDSLAAIHAARAHPPHAMPRAHTLTRIYYVRDRQHPGERNILRHPFQYTCLPADAGTCRVF